MKGKIIKSSKRIFECRLDNGDIISATAHGKLYKNSRPVVGDICEIQKEKDEYEITAIAERQNEVYRLLIRENKKKVIASNVDVMVIVMSVSLPPYKRGLLDRYLLRAIQWDIAPCIVFNKMDQYDPEEFDLQFEIDRLNKLGVECFEISSTEMDYKNQFLDNDLKTLKSLLPGKTAMFIGHSGVGKSKLITALSSGEIELISGGLAKVGKGAHTTTWAEIINFGNFDLIDSPGVRTLSIEDIPKEELEDLFPDLFEYFQNCKFKDCRHNNNKGCAFSHLDEDKIEDQMVLSRLDSFLRFRDEIEAIPEWEKN